MRAIIDAPVARVAVKALAPLAAGLSGVFAQANPAVAVVLIGIAVADVVADYFISHRITTLIHERISGILEAAYHACAFPDRSDVRATVFSAAPHTKDRLRQICPYYPSNTYSSYRRGIPVSKGVVGLCFRSRKQCHEAIDSTATFKESMIDRWGFTSQEADSLRIRLGYLAIPVLNAQGDPTGVVYFDSARPDAFGRESVDILGRACVPLAKWLR